MVEKLKSHWREYLIEGVLLGIFMLSACFFTALLEYPGSPVLPWFASPTVRRVLIGVAMGLTAVLLIYSPWGRRSGAHMNPCVTLTFFRLKKVGKTDAAFYALAQFFGATAAVVFVAAGWHGIIAHPTVDFVTTKPGPQGPIVAFAAEALISFILMLVVLIVSSTPKIARFTGLCAGLLVAIYIGVEAPLSGMSINPARTFGSAFAAWDWASIWLYFVAPPLGMLLAAEVYLRLPGMESILCAKLHHDPRYPCHFCEYHKRGDKTK